MQSRYVLPRNIPLFEDSAACLSTIDRLRFGKGPDCPRCGSKNVRPRVESQSPQSYVCHDCDYAFNAAAGTVFMGTRLPIASYLQAFAIYDALGESVTIKEISFAIGSSDRAIKGVMGRVKSLQLGIKFTAIDAPLVRKLRSQNGHAVESRAQNFFGFCESKSILIDESALMHFLDAVSNTAMPELVTAYGRRGRTRSKQASDKRG